MSEATILLTLEGVSQRLGGAQILEGVSFRIRDLVRPGKVTGQVASLLGPSGVGKTRLLRIIAGLDAPDSGTVLGPDNRALAPGSVGVVFQSYPLLRHRTILSNLEIVGIANGVSGAESRKLAKELLGRFGLSHRESFHPSQLSGGQRQRAAIAQQLMRRPQLLLMDEPFSGLDPAALSDVMKLLQEVANTHEYNTIIVVTHDIGSALAVSDTLFMLGRDRNDQGHVISGAKIKKTLDLVAMGLAWRENVELDPLFGTVERELRAEFRAL